MLQDINKQTKKPQPQQSIRQRGIVWSRVKIDKVIEILKL